MSNREISAATGVPQATIERRLRRAIATIAQFVERGRGLGQRALGAFVIWLSGRWFHDSVLPVAQATAVAGMAAVMMVQTPPIALPAPLDRAAPVVSSAPAGSRPNAAVPPAPAQAAPQQDASTPTTIAAPVSVPGAPLPVPVPVQLPVAPPPVPAVPVTIKPPQL